jgi:hypothetical protein
MFGGPAFRTLSRGRSHAGESNKVISESALADFGVFNHAYPATRADEMIYRLVLDIVEERGSIDSSDLLDTLILATHPDICRALSPKKPTRKTEALFDSIRTEIDLIDRNGLRWHECLEYLQVYRRAITVHLDVPDRPVSRGPEFDAVRNVAPSVYMPVALFALSVIDALKKNPRTRGPMTERSHASRSFEQLKAQYASP